MKVFVQFKDATETIIVGAFGCQQDPGVFPHQGEVESDDPRYQDFLDSLPKDPLAVEPQQPA